MINEVEKQMVTGKYRLVHRRFIPRNSVDVPALSTRVHRRVPHPLSKWHILSFIIRHHC